MNRKFSLAVVLALVLVAMLGVGAASAADPVPFFNPGVTFPVTFNAKYCTLGTPSTCVATDLVVNQDKTYTSSSGASGTVSVSLATRTVTLNDVSGCVVPLKFNSTDVALEGVGTCNGVPFATIYVLLPPVTP